jgi:hypothetical protein
VSRNLMHEHPSEEVRSAMVRLADALCQWERTTGRAHVIIVKDGIGCEYRALDSAPAPADVSDLELLSAFEGLVSVQNGRVS